MARNSLALRKRLSLNDYYQLSKQIALDYANSADCIARSVLMERYNITESTYYYLLEMAITHSLVSDATVVKIKEKILANNALHDNHGYNSTVKYKRLELQRKNYSAFSKVDILYITKFYANNPQQSKKEIAKFFHFTSTTTLDQILKRACVELIITDKIFQKLRERALINAINSDSSQNTTNLERTERFFDLLSEIRKTERAKRKAEETSSF